MAFSYKYDKVDEIGNLPSGTQIAVKGSFKNLHPSLAFFYPLFSPDEYYFHHGVYLGNCQVAHFSGENKADAKPRYCDILQFMKATVDGELYQVKYDNPDLLVSVTATVDFAEAVVKNPTAWPGYQIRKNNCESFATWLKTGESISAQATEAHIDISNLGKSVAAKLSSCPWS